MLAFILHMDQGRIAFSIGPFDVYWYGIFVCLGFVTAFALMHWQARWRGLPPEQVMDLSIPAIIGGILGARLVYVATYYREFAADLSRIWRIREGGLVFYGGFIGAALTVWLTVRLKKLPVGAVADIIAVALPAGQALGRLGCFMNGCCFGRPWDGALSVIYPTGSAVFWTQIRKLQIPRYADACLAVRPAQLFQSAIDVGICLTLLLLARRVKVSGQLFALYLILYSIGRFLNEFNRGDYLVYYGGLTIAQVVSLVVLPVGIGLFVYLGRRGRAEADGST